MLCSFIYDGLRCTRCFVRVRLHGDRASVRCSGVSAARRSKICRVGFVNIPGPPARLFDNAMTSARTGLPTSNYRDEITVLLHGWSRPFDLRRPSATAEFCSHAFAWRSCMWLRPPPLLILGSSSLRPHAAFARCVASGPSGVSFAFSFVCLRPCTFAST